MVMTLIHYILQRLETGPLQSGALVGENLCSALFAECLLRSVPSGLRFCTLIILFGFILSGYGAYSNVLSKEITLGVDHSILGWGWEREIYIFFCNKLFPNQVKKTFDLKL